jgi:hypothetical protein
LYYGINETHLPLNCKPAAGMLFEENEWAYQTTH